MTREDSESRAKEKLLGYLKCLEHAISKYVQHVPATLHAFLQLPVMRSEGNSELKSSHSQFIGLFRRAVGVPKGTLIRNAARDLYKGGGGSNPVQWMRATICTLVFEFSIDSGSLFDDPEILEKLLAKRKSTEMKTTDFPFPDDKIRHGSHTGRINNHGRSSSNVGRTTTNICQAP